MSQDVSHHSTTQPAQEPHSDARRWSGTEPLTCTVRTGRTRRHDSIGLGVKGSWVQIPPSRHTAVPTFRRPDIRRPDTPPSRQPPSRQTDRAACEGITAGQRLGSIPDHQSHGDHTAWSWVSLHPERVYGLVTVSGYNIQNISSALEPIAPELEHTYWYQYYFHSERGRRGLDRHRDELCNSFGAHGRRHGLVRLPRLRQALRACITPTLSMS